MLPAKSRRAAFSARPGSSFKAGPSDMTGVSSSFNIKVKERAGGFISTGNICFFVLPFLWAFNTHLPCAEYRVLINYFLFLNLYC